MAATVTGQAYYNWPGGPAQPPFSKFTVTGDNSYPTGGYPITKAQMGYPNSVDVFAFPGSTNIGGVDYNTKWDDANQKLKVYVDSTGLEVAPGVDLTALVFLCLTIGI